MPATAHRRRLRNYLINPRYQLRHSLVLVVISASLTAGLGYFWYEEMRVASRTIEVKALVSMDEESVREVRQDLAASDRQRILVLVGFGALLALIVAGYGLVITHKVAGPLFKLDRYMGQVREGRLGKIYGPRRRDQLQDFFESFRQMHAALRKQTEDEVLSLERMISLAEQHLAENAAAANDPEGRMDRTLEALKAMRDRKVASLKD